MRVYLSIVIPVRNEERNLPLLTARISEVRATLPETEVVFVEGGSTDGSASIVDKLAADHNWVKAIHEPVTGDLARVWRQGVALSTGEIIALMDADLCHDPLFLPKLAAELDAGADLAIAGRVDGARVRMPHKALYRKAATLMSGWSFRWLTGYAGRDPAHGFRAFRRRAYEATRTGSTTPGNAWCIEQVWLFGRAGLTVSEIPYDYGERIHGKDQLSAPREARRYAGLLMRMAIWMLTASRRKKAAYVI